ncbi:dephospho-CoA kinase [Crenothrix polyspora]|uniref:Dephospho-CoA kinase n=1 Tax=Crenothrix polyspora TaxID=360316 RepID=A0A1R4HCX8_9GAMM|nr:dephospho-CoA kinase [Crenothrix polyspora]SJM94082.1 dephospho-CoA kinase [Crenothrix polyspora]
MLKIGLTGGIGSGKTTVTQLFAALNVPIIDADELAHQLVAVGQPALKRIQTEFGAAVINADGSLNRKEMRERIFSDAAAKNTLEVILHPLIYAAIQAKINQLTAAYCIICVPLLFETQMTAIADRILIIDCPVGQQIERVKLRDQLTREKIQAIIDSQISRENRLSKADDIINNSATDADLGQQVKALHHLYISLSTL